MPRLLRSVHHRATESNQMTRRPASPTSAPHHSIPTGSRPTGRVLSTPEILRRIQAMYADRDGPAGTDQNPPPS